MPSPVTVAEAITHLRLTGSENVSERLEIQRMLDAATEYAEQYTRRTWQTKTRSEFYTTFPGSSSVGMFLPGGPVSAITSVTYYDSTPTQQTWAGSEYRVVTVGGRSYLFPAFTKTYPTDCGGEPANIEIQFSVGLAAASVPEGVKAAILLIVGSLYEYREDGIVDNAGLAQVEAPVAAKRLLHPYKASL